MTKTKLQEKNYKIDFWYDHGKLDAICIAKWEGADLILKKEYREKEIAEIILDNFLNSKERLNQ